MPTNRNSRPSSSFSKPSTARNDKKLRKAQETENRRFKPKQDPNDFDWNQGHSILLKRLFIRHYQKGKPSTVIFDKFNELASTDLLSEFLSGQLKELTDRGGKEGVFARIMRGKKSPKKNPSGLITGQKGAAVKL